MSEDSYWEGAAKFVKVKDRDDIGRVIQAGTNIGHEYCYGVMFDSTGEVKHYSVRHVTRCDPQGNTEAA